MSHVACEKKWRQQCRVAHGGCDRVAVEHVRVFLNVKSVTGKTVSTWEILLIYCQLLITDLVLRK